jgi:MFS family permease
MPAFRHLVAGATLATAGALGALTWLPALLTRVHGFTLAQAGLVLALGFGVFGAAGTYAVGRIADGAAKTDARRKAWVTGASQLLIAALWLPALLADDRAWVIVAAIVPCALAGAYLGPTIAMIQDVVDPRARAFSAAIAILVINLIGASAGPLVVGALSDLLAPRFGVQSLSYALIAVPVFLAWSALHYARAGGGRL